MYWAELDEDNMVIRVIVADEAFIKTLPGRWVETCDKGIKSKNYAGKGMRHNPKENCFEHNTLELKSVIEDAKDENGKQLYKKVILGENKHLAKKIPLKHKRYYLECKVTKRKFKSNRKCEILHSHKKEE